LESEPKRFDELLQGSEFGGLGQYISGSADQKTHILCHPKQLYVTDGESDILAKELERQKLVIRKSGAISRFILPVVKRRG